MRARLAHRILQDARIQAFKHPVVGPPGVGFRGGLVLTGEDDRLRQRRANCPFDSWDSEAEYPNRLSGDYIYGGVIYHHFGHFMAEMVHRIVPSKILFGDSPFIFVTYSGNREWISFASMPRFIRDVFNILGIGPSNFHIIADNTMVDRLFVVEQGSEQGLGPKPGYLDDLHEYVGPRLDVLHHSDTRPSKVYVSRRAMPGGNFLGESYLESQLTDEDFTIIQPENLPVSVQMDIYRKADILIFNTGSACHGVELLGSGSLQRCYLLDRGWSAQTRTMERALAPRAREFAKSTGHPYLGTLIALKASGRPMPHLGMSLLDPHALVTFFRSHDIARLPDFDSKQYIEAAEAHLEQHFEAAKPEARLCLAGAKEVLGFFEAFLAAKAVALAS